MKKKYDVTKTQMGVLYTFDDDGNVVFTDKNFIWGHLKINQKVDFDRLEDAINYCFKKHDTMRIKLCEEDGKLLQYFNDYVKQDIEIVDVNTEADVKKLENDILNKPFEMFDSFLFHVVIYKYKNGFGGIILSLNHVIADGYTIGLLLYELLGYYSKKVNKFISFSYLNFINKEARYPSSRKCKHDKKYWNNMFNTGIPASVCIPSNKKNYSLSKANKLIFDIDSNIIKKVKSFCKINNISNSTFYMSIYAIYMYKKTNLTDFFLGTASKNRRSIKENLTAGMFASTAYFDVKIQDEKFVDFAKRIRFSLKSGYKHMDYITHYTRELFDQYNDDRLLPTNVILSYQNLYIDKDKLNLNFEIDGDNNVGTYGSDITIIHIFEYNNNVKIIYDYLSEKYSVKEITKLNDEITSIIKQVCEDNSIYTRDIKI